MLPDGPTRPDVPDLPPPPPCTFERVAEREVARDTDGPVNAPDLFYTGDRIGVLAFASRTVEHPILVMTQIDRALDDVAPLRQVGEESHSWGHAAWTGDAVGICWDGDPGGIAALRMREIAGLDGALGTRIDFAPESGPCTSLEHAHGRYAMTWRREYEVGSGYVVDGMFQLFERDGVPLGEPTVLSNAPYPGRTPSVLPTEDGFVAVTSVDDAIRIVRVDARGAVLRDDTIPISGAAYAAAALRGDELGVLALEGPADTRALVMRTFDASMRETGSRVIEDGAPTAAYPRLVARPEGWLLLWGLGSRPTDQLVLLSLRPDLVPLAPRQVFHDGPSSGYGGPSPMSVDASLYVGLSRPPLDMPSAHENVWVERWDCTAPPDDPCVGDDAAATGRCSLDRFFGYAWNGSGCFAVRGCDCAGTDCARLPETRFQCESDRVECTAARCSVYPVLATELCGPSEVASRTTARFTMHVESVCRCPPVHCEARPTGALELTLSIGQCDVDGPICDCMEPPPGANITCDLPPMQEGDWTIRLPGGATVPLVVRPPWEMADPTEACRSLTDE